MNQETIQPVSQQGIQPHNNKAAATWSGGGLNYGRIGYFISGAIEHCIAHLVPQLKKLYSIS